MAVRVRVGVVGLSASAVLLAAGVLLLNLGCCWVGVVEGWSDDLFFFTSFKNVSEWGELYERCVKQKEPVRHHLTPVILPPWQKLHKPPPHLGKRTLHIYNKPPPRQHGAYSVSYTFGKENECLYHKLYAPCYIARQAAYIRAVVLRTAWQSSKELRDTFKIEDEEEYGSIIAGEDGANEKYFTAALFLGSVVDPVNNTFRSTHWMHGKSYPMEIYMFFVDEELTAAQKYVTLVVLVEESEEGEDENRWVNPIVKAVKNHLILKERQFLRDKLQIFQRERMFHHSQIRGCRNYPESCAEDKDWGGTPAEEWKRYVDTQEEWQQYLAYETKIKFDAERKDKLDNLILGLRPKINVIPRSIFYATEIAFWLLPSIARHLRFDPSTAFVNLDNNTFNRTTLATRMTDQYWPLEGLTDDEMEIYVRRLEKTVMNPAAKAYVDWVESQDYGCTLEGNNRKNGRIEDFQWWKRLETSYPRSREDIQENLKKGKDDLHPLVKVLLALHNVTEGKHPLLNCTLHCTEKEWNPNFEIKLTEQIMFLQEIVVIIKNLLTYKKNRERIDMDFYSFAHDAGHENVTVFLDRTMDVKKDRIKHYESEQGIEVDVSDPYDSYFTRRTDPIEAGNLGLRKKDNEDYLGLNSPTVPLSAPFQFSWLIPKGGGYFMYKGTLPVPPCYRTEMTYVFNHTIQMSKEQIKWLTTVPTSWSRDVSPDITSTFAPVHETYYYVPTYFKNNKSIPFEMYFDNRNHLTLGKDFFHDNSLDSAHSRREKEANMIETQVYGKYGGGLKSSSPDVLSSLTYYFYNILIMLSCLISLYYY